MIDQAVLSGLNMFIGGLFIATATKEEYGVYALAFAFVLLLNSVQSAVITTPLTANGARLNAVHQERLVDAMFRLQTGLLIVLGVVTAFGVRLWAQAQGDGLSWGLALGTSIAMVGAWMREFRRTEHFLRLDPWRVFTGDLVYVGLACVGLVVLYMRTGTMRASWALLIVGFAGVATGVIRVCRLSGDWSGPPWRSTLSVLTHQVRWTLPNVFVTWGQSTSYTYVVALVAGSAAVADLSAARLFLTPVSFAVLAWSRLFMPKAGALLSTDNNETVMRLTRRGGLELTGLLASYLLVLALFFGAGGGKILPAKYSEVGLLVAVRGAYFLVNLLRGVESTALMAHAAFRVLFVDTLWAATLSVPLMIVLGFEIGAPGVVYGMTVGEALLAALLWRELRIRTRAESAVLGRP